MPKFDFRLQKVLEYRELEEGWAKDAYVEARAARLEVEAEIMTIDTRREALLREPVLSLGDYRSLEGVIISMDDDERHARIRLGVLADEADKALAAWQTKHQEVEALRKMKDQAFSEWMLDENRREQAELDDWTVTRRAA